MGTVGICSNLTIKYINPIPSCWADYAHHLWLSPVDLKMSAGSG